MYPEQPRSNWWYLLPILFGIIGGVIAYFVIKNDDLKKAKTCLCIGLLAFLGVIGGIISYFVLRKDYPKRAKIFLYLGIIISAIGIVTNLIFGDQLMELDPEFGVNI